MEDVLEVYQQPHDAARPLVCLDEASKRLVAETRKAIPVERGTPQRIDAEYRRCGTASVFMLNAPLEGRRHVRVRERRTRKDFAEVIRELCDELYPGAEPDSPGNHGEFLARPADTGPLFPSCRHHRVHVGCYGNSKSRFDGTRDGTAGHEVEIRPANHGPIRTVHYGRDRKADPGKSVLSDCIRLDRLADHITYVSLNIRRRAAPV